MADSAIGATVLYCGHKGYFIADILSVGDVNVVRANGPVTPGNLVRDCEFGPATHHLRDFPTSGFWCPERGVFVVPKEQVVKMKGA